MRVGHYFRGWLFCLLILAGGCSNEKTIADFTSDGCSLFPDSSVILKQDWTDCCFQHDLAYWRGGTEAERLAADQALRECILKKTGNPQLAELMFQGVRLGGSPYFYNWYRWGYGWNYSRKYAPLTEEEKEQVEAKLEKYYANEAKKDCGC